jgi:transposase
MTTSAILGIDVSKATLSLALLREGNRIRKKEVSNDAVGFAQLSEWLTKQGVQQVHACLEATNTYGQGVARYLYEQGHRVSVVNPLRIQGFAQGELVRTKTDSRDASTAARFCAAMNPPEWKPLEPASEELQQMSRRVEALQQMIVQEKNRLDTCAEVLREEIEAHIKFLETQMEKLREKIETHVNGHDSLRETLNLLTTIKGISTISGTQVLAEIVNWKEFRSARQLAAYAGLTPQAKESGTSVHGKTRLCKIGNAHLRRALYFPALTLLRWSEPIKAWAEELRGRGKTNMQVVGAVMHKLVRIIFGVLKSGKPFNPELLAAKA